MICLSRYDSIGKFLSLQLFSVAMEQPLRICTVAFAISYNHEYSRFIHECIVAFVNTTLSWMRQFSHEMLGR
jgi:hypothetical protein